MLIASANFTILSYHSESRALRKARAFTADVLAMIDT